MAPPCLRLRYTFCYFLHSVGSDLIFTKDVRFLGIADIRTDLPDEEKGFKPSEVFRLLQEFSFWVRDGARLVKRSSSSPWTDQRSRTFVSILVPIFGHKPVVGFIESYEIDLLSCMRLGLLRFGFMLHANLFSEGYAVLGSGVLGTLEDGWGL